MEHIVVDGHERGRGARLLAGLGDHHGEHIAGVGSAAAFGDQDGPVLVDQPDPQLAGDVGGGEHGHHAGRATSGLDVDAPDLGPGVVGEPQGGVQEARRAQVVDVAAIAEGELGRLVLDAPAADAARRGDRHLLAGRHRLYGVHDLHVAGAPAQVGAEVTRHVLAREVGALLVDLRLGPHDDPGMQKPHWRPPQALKASA